jgi:hypothetical protein
LRVMIPPRSAEPGGAPQGEHPGRLPSPRRPECRTGTVSPLVRRSAPSSGPSDPFSTRQPSAAAVDLTAAGFRFTVRRDRRQAALLMQQWCSRGLSQNCTLAYPPCQQEASTSPVPKQSRSFGARALRGESGCEVNTAFDAWTALYGIARGAAQPLGGQECGQLGGLDRCGPCRHWSRSLGY